MDVKRVESIAVPTALATVGGSIAGYMIPRMIKDGKMTDEFLKYTANIYKANDEKLIKEADTLDKITFIPAKEEVERKTFGKKNRRNRILKLHEKESKKGNRKLEKFVMKNAENIGVERKEGQSLKEAVKEFIKGKTIEEIKEAFLPKIMRETIKNTDYEKLLKETFDEAFDSKTKAFKKDAEKDTVKMFKRFATDMKLKSAGKWGAITGAIAMLSAVSANIANKISNR